jgi:hypothetical protein
MTTETLTKIPDVFWLDNPADKEPEPDTTEMRYFKIPEFSRERSGTGCCRVSFLAEGAVLIGGTVARLSLAGCGAGAVD